MKRFFFLAFAAVAIVASSAFFKLHPGQPADPNYFCVDTIARDMIVPWDMVFLPDSSLLFTERPGRVRLVNKQGLKSSPIFTVADIEVKGKMGLLALCLHPSFQTNHLLYLAYNYREGNTTFLRVVRYTYDQESMSGGKTIIEKIPGVFNHTGCRLVFGPDKKLYITTGDADVPRLAQDLKALNGKTLRLNEDGTIPTDNPFVGNDTARKEIWTYGHRNSQGIAFQPGTDILFNSEHGPTGGDEINIVTRGNNYGWPVAHHRNNIDGMMLPVMEFTPSIGPAEALFYSGKAFPSMKGNLLVGCMRGESILAINFQQNKISDYQFLLKKVYGRIRALKEAPDGSIYFSTTNIDPPERNTLPGDGSFDLVLRMRPATANEISAGKALPIKGESLHQAINIGQPANSTAHATIPQLYTQLCAGCHGANMEGVDTKPGLLAKKLNYGNSFNEIRVSIMEGIVTKGMPAWKGVLTDFEAAAMVKFIQSKRN